MPSTSMSSQVSHNSPPPSFIQRRLILPFKQALQTGITAQKLAQTVSLGIVLGLFPILGLTTVLCFVAAYKLSLNQPIIQATNFLMTPFCLATSIPFMRIGETLTGREPLTLSPAELAKQLKSEGFVKGAGMAFGGLGCAALGWAVVAGPLTWGLYMGLKPVMRHLLAMRKESLSAKDVVELEEPLLSTSSTGSLRDD
ncbi:hypothetical protein HK097_000042 [Rhizophlyctis rosea]|uniref:DUF2062 domain-containing protein n=1 Tax=Rhizophlyctis rosea TaxID=64517 RepID=A0AAD5SLY0_9FUNG|nr:hypothetical protein HK097_000042 [Rhizophlyctis rosea]